MVKPVWFQPRDTLVPTGTDTASVTRPKYAYQPPMGPTDGEAGVHKKFRPEDPQDLLEALVADRFHDCDDVRASAPAEYAELMVADDPPSTHTLPPTPVPHRGRRVEGLGDREGWDCTTGHQSSRGHRPTPFQDKTQGVGGKGVEFFAPCRERRGKVL